VLAVENFVVVVEDLSYNLVITAVAPYIEPAGLPGDGGCGDGKGVDCRGGGRGGVVAGVARKLFIPSCISTAAGAAGFPAQKLRVTVNPC